MLFRDVSYGFILLAMLGGLACAFYVPYKRRRSRMTMLWLFGWGTVVLRTAVVNLDIAGIHLMPYMQHMFADILLGTGAVIFLWSLSVDGAWRPLVLPWPVLLMLTVGLYCVLANLWFQPSTPHAVILIFVIAIGLAIGVCWAVSSAELPGAVSLPLILGTAILGSIVVLRGNYFVPIYLMQSSLNICTAIYMLRRYRVLPAAAIVTAGSFILWAGLPYAHLISPGPPLLAPILAAYMISSGLILLTAAEGMLLLLMEEEVQQNIQARDREQRLRQELEAYAQFDLHMMPGADPQQAAERVCRLVAEHSIFREACIFMRDVKQTFYIAASENMSPELVRALEALGQRMTDARLRDFQNDLRRQRISLHSSRVNLRALFLPGDPLQQLNFLSAISINLRSQTGMMMGTLLLGAEKDPREEDLRADDLLPLETLVGKLAIAIENAMLTQRLLRSEKLAGLGQLAGGVAHELNNPLTVVMGYAELMSDAADAEIREQAAIIHKEAMRMKTIVESLVRFWKPSQNSSQPVNLAQMLRDIYHLRAPQLERLGIRFEIVVADTLPEIAGNPDQLKQVFLQLVNNAAEAISKVDTVARADAAFADGTVPGTHKIRMDASFDEQKLHILFSDTGPGFHDPHRVFDPFFTTKAPGEGSGLGLSICYGIIHEHRGEINAFNLHPFGAAVIVDLPIRDKSAAVTPERPDRIRNRALNGAVPQE